MTNAPVKILIISVASFLTLACNVIAQEKADTNKNTAKQFNEAMMTGPAHEDEFYIAKARDYIEKHKDYYQIASLAQELRLEIAFRDPPPFTNVDVVFYQIVNDIPVERATIGAAFRQNGKMYSISSSFDPAARRVNTTPSITGKQAIDIAVNDKAPKEAYKAELLIKKFDNQFRLTWKITPESIRATYVGTWYIDADSGVLLKYESPVVTPYIGKGSRREECPDD
jgi:Zn-dependent metalloprotease